MAVGFFVFFFFVCFLILVLFLLVECFFILVFCVVVVVFCMCKCVFFPFFSCFFFFCLVFFWGEGSGQALKFVVIWLIITHILIYSFTSLCCLHFTLIKLIFSLVKMKNNTSGYLKLVSIAMVWYDIGIYLI